MSDIVDQLVIRPMTRDELDTLVEWAAQEGWNPGIDDAQVFWDTDPEGFIAAELEGQLIGGGSIVSYNGDYGFMGFFIIHPDYRGKGLGNRLWHERKKRLQERLNEDASIGMDGVFDMQAYYAKGGFVFAERDLRFEGIAETHEIAPNIVPVDQVDFQALNRYDQRHFPTERRQFLKDWIQRPNGHAFACVVEGSIKGYAVMRPCREGYKIGPLFADGATIADQVFKALSNQVPGEKIYLDIHQDNPYALALVHMHKMKEVFGCARMYLGPRPQLPIEQIYGITTFELG